jgi:hypothetical protein
MIKRYYDELLLWRVNEARGTTTQIRRAPREIRGKYEIWRSLIELEGPDRVSEIRGFSASAGRGSWERTWYVELGFLWVLRCYTRPEIREVLVLKLQSGYEARVSWEAALERRELEGRKLEPRQLDA